MPYIITLDSPADADGAAVVLGHPVATNGRVRALFGGFFAASEGLASVARPDVFSALSDLAARGIAASALPV